MNYKLKLIKGRSYTGYGVKVRDDKPIVTVKDKETSDALMATGYFSLVNVGDSPAPPTISEPLNTDSDDNIHEHEKQLEKMTEKQLESFAVENRIDLAGAKGKADKLERIKQFLADNDSGGGEIDLGGGE
jgi:hypothetical protein